MVQPVEAQYNVLFQKKVCVKNYLLLQQSLLFVIPPTPTHSLSLPLTLIIDICDVSRPLALSIISLVTR